MKAKSKVLLGLLVALAMMVFAVPAFAEVTFTVSDPTPDNVVVMHDGTDADTKTVKLTITEATSKQGDTYDITPTVDGTAGTAETATVATAGTPVEYTYTTPAGLAVGNHTITFSVTKTGGDLDTRGTKAPSKALTVKVINEFTAELRGAGTKGTDPAEYAKTVVKGDDSGLSAYSSATSTATYQWQSSGKLDGADDAKSTKWTNISGKTSAQLGNVDSLNGKYVRCLVTNDGETLVASPTNSPAVASDYAVKLTVNDTAKITLDETKMVDATYFVGQTPTNLEIAASGGTPAYSYKWIVDGVKEGTASTYTKAPDVTKAGTYTYAVEVTDNSSTPLTATSKTVTITVVDTPVLKMTNASNETAATYGAALAAEPGNGDVVVAEADKAKDLTLTPIIENKVNVKSTLWRKSTATSWTSGENYTVKAADIKTGDQYILQVGFEGIDAPLQYTVTLKVSSGSITAGTTGGIFTQVDDSVSVRPEYTVTLPEGVQWGKYITDLTAGADINDTVNSKVAFTINTPGGVTAKLKTAVTDAKKPLVFYLNGTSTTKPYVKDLTLTINQKVGNTADDVVLANVDTEKTEAPAAVILPVSKDIGYKVTVKATKALVKVDKPDASTVSGKESEHPTPYTGDVIKATLKPSDTAAQNGLTAADIENIRYYAESDKAKATPITEPKDVGKYFIRCDIKETANYAGAKDVDLDHTLNITQVTLTDDNAKNYLKMDPTTVEYDGQNKKTEVTFKDGITGAGAVDEITYKALNSTTGAVINQNVVPVKVGKYNVYATTKSPKGDGSDCTNIAAQSTPKLVGVFEITKTQADAKNYTIDPAEVTADGTPRDAIVKVADGAGKVTAKHYFKDGSEEELKDIPSEAGVYTVKVDTEENDTYAEGKMLEIGTFTIKDAESEQPEIWMIGHVQDVDWGDKGSGKAVKLEAGKTAQVGTTGLGKRVEAITILVPEDYTVEGFAHIQDKDDVAVEKDENPTYIKNMNEIPKGYVAYKFGTTGEGKRIEAINIAIKDADGKYVEGLEYATHVQNMGWLGTVRNGSFSGSRGLALRMEAVRFYYDDQIRKPTDIDKEVKETELR